MGIKIFETRQNLINKLKSRELQFDDDKMKEVLIKYNYFNSKEEIIDKLLEKSKMPLALYYYYDYYRI